MAEEIERRNLAGKIQARPEFRNGNPTGKQKIVGYAAVFNSLSENLGGFREKISPGAFAQAIQQDDVRALLNHDPNLVLGRNVSGTLELREDSVGLRYEILPPRTSYANDLLESLERGDIDQSSFGFMVIDEEWTPPGPDQPLPVRTIRKARLFDVSPVTFPAYSATSSGVTE